VITLALDISNNDNDDMQILAREWEGPLLPVGTWFFLSQRQDCLRRARVTEYEADIYTSGNVTMVCDLTLNKEDVPRMTEIVQELLNDGWSDITNE